MKTVNLYTKAILFYMSLFSRMLFKHILFGVSMCFRKYPPYQYVCVSLMTISDSVWCILVTCSWGGEVKSDTLFLLVMEGFLPKLGENVIIKSHREEILSLCPLSETLRNRLLCHQDFFTFWKGKTCRFCTFLIASAEPVVTTHYHTVFL